MRALLHLLLLGVAAGCAARPAAPPSQDLPTKSFREEHKEIRTHLSHVSAWVSRMPEASPADRKELMANVLGFLKDHLLPHAGWEERVLYPAIDRRAGSPAAYPFTSSMRWEHRIVGRWIGELETIAADRSPDIWAFVRRAYNLLGLVAAHFEEEEEVLLPVLDRTMTADEFQREMGGHE